MGDVEDKGLSHNNDRYQRWQKITIDQFSYTLNLVLTFNVAALGYWFVLISDHAFIPGPPAGCWMLLSLTALCFSSASGLACSINRLLDFRGTARKVRGKPDAQSREELNALGRVSWGLLWFELAGFALGAVSLGLALLLTYGGKLA